MYVANINTVVHKFLTENVSLIVNCNVKYFRGYITSSEYYYVKHILLVIIHTMAVKTIEVTTYHIAIALLIPLFVQPDVPACLSIREY